MKIRNKMLVGIAVAIACVSLLTVTAFANSSSTLATGYGTLTGTLYGAEYTTGVTTNSDNAYLTITAAIQDINGVTLDSRYSQSQRSWINYSGRWTSLPSQTYVLYGTHGVQGGSTYGAYAVYTYTHN